MKKLLYTALLSCFLCPTSFAQNPSWILAPKFFNGFGVIPLPIPTTYFGDPTNPISNNPYNGYAGQSATNTSNMITKPDGSILFFIVDQFIYDGKGYIIDRLDYQDAGGGSETAIKGAAELMIVPNPGNCQQYYIFTTRIAMTNKTPYVFLLDMSIQNTINTTSYPTLGALVSIGSGVKGKKIAEIEPNYQSSTGPSGTSKLSNAYFAASQFRAATNDYLVFISDGGGIFRFKINASGITSDNGGVGFGTTAFNPEETRGEMELVKMSNGNYRIATIYAPGGMVIGGQNVKQSIFTAMLNSNGVLISGSQKEFPIFDNSNYASVSGLEFSSSGRYLYVTHLTNAIQPNQLEYYDFNVPTPNLLPLSVPNGIDLRFSQIELGASNKLFFANQNGLYTKINAEIPTSQISQSSSFTYAISTETGPSAYTVVANRFRYLLPDQIDGENYNNHFIANTACCIINGIYDKEFFTASVNATWQPGINSNPITTTSSAVVYIKNELRIPAGRTIIIKNMEFRFAPGARVIIEQGANNSAAGGRLILDGTIFTNDTTCANQLWQGIEVWGNATLSQQSSSQGRLIMKNNSSVNNAQIGVLLSKRLYPNSTIKFDHTRNGGIVQSSNSSLINNDYGVYFHLYLPSIQPLNNYSYFTNTRFEWNSLARPTNSNPTTHAFMNSVRGINFKGCDFNMTNLLFGTFTGTTYGIFSSNSQFYVDEYCSVLTQNGSPCPSPDASTFLNLTYGVRTNNPAQFSYTVNKSIFTNCRYGIYSYSAKNQRITKNTFKVRELLGTQTAGVALYYCSGYTVEENNFEEFNNPAVAHGSRNSYGVVVHNSGTDHNEIYKNTFKDLKVGGQSEATNGIGTSTPYNSAIGGLQWKCNTFRTDIYEADLGVAGIIDYQQGYIDPSNLNSAILKSARNIFSLFDEDSTFFPDHDIKVNPTSQIPSTYFQYVHIDVDSQRPDNYFQILVGATPALYNGNHVTSTTNMCPSRLNQTIIGLSDILKDKKTEKEQVEIEIQNAGGAQLADLQKELHYLSGTVTQLRNEIGSRLILDSSVNASLIDYDNFLNVQDDNEAKRDLIYSNIAQNSLNNGTLINELSQFLSSEEIEFLSILEALRPVIDIETAITDSAMLARIISVANSTSDLMTAAKAKALLATIGMVGSDEDFWPLEDASRTQLFSSSDKVFVPSSSVIMYPNPTNGAVNFTSASIERLFSKVEVFDLSGVKVADENFDETTNKNLNFNKLSTGVYVVKIYSNNGMMETKLLNLK